MPATEGIIMPRGTIERTRVRIPTVILVHTFELGFVALFEIVGFGLLLQGSHLHVSSVQTLPDPLVWCWEVCLILGGAAIVFGLLWRRTPIMGRALETAGLYLGAAAWATYAATIWSVIGGLGTQSALQGLVIAVVCLLRIAALKRVEKVIAKVNETPAPDVTS